MIHLHHKEQKPGLRHHYLALRSTISAEDCARWSIAFSELFLKCHSRESGNLAQHATAIAGYHATRNELDVLPLLAQLHAKGHITTLPAIENNSKLLTFRRWQLGDTLVQGPYNIHEPTIESPITTPGIIIVPLLAFDRTGHRLGFGAGYYDTTLKRLRTQGKVLAIGAAFSLQEHPSLPADPHDERLDYVVTEKEIIVIPAKAGIQS